MKNILCLLLVPLLLQPHTASAKPQNAAHSIVYAFSATPRLYHITAYVDGHFPPFDQPGNPEVHLLASITAKVTARKLKNGDAKISFQVQKADLGLVQNRLKTGVIPDANSLIPYPIDLYTVQSALDTNVLVDPHGQVIHIDTAPSKLIRINIGFDLRSLYMLAFPVIFPTRPLSDRAQWYSRSGLIGSHLPQKAYNARITAFNANSNSMQLQQTALNMISDELNQSGEHTSSPAKAVTSLKGSIALQGNMSFELQNAVNYDKASLSSALFRLNANLNRKAIGKVTPDSDMQTGPIQVAIRLLIKPNN